MKQTGITINEKTGDLKVKVSRDSLGLITGGLLVGDVQKQNQAIIIYMYPGEMKEKPTIGVGICSMLLSSEALHYKHKIREQLEADGFRVNYLDIKVTADNSTDIQINAEYKQ